VTYEGRIKGFWPAKDVGQQNQREGFYKDTDGHGTSVASALLNVDPFCHVYIARAFTSRNEQQGLQMSGEVEENVAKVWQVFETLVCALLIFYSGNQTCSTPMESRHFVAFLWLWAGGSW
jgi:hypothetical protein